MEPLFSASNRPKFLTTVRTTIGTGVVIGRSENYNEVLIGFNRDQMDPQWLEDNPGIQGNPNLWIELDKILEDLGAISIEARKAKLRKTRHGKK